jgi:hypothetical protein
MSRRLPLPFNHDGVSDGSIHSFARIIDYSHIEL